MTNKRIYLPFLTLLISLILLSACNQVPKYNNINENPEQDNIKLEKYLYNAVINIIEYQCNYYLINHDWSTDNSAIDSLLNSNIYVSKVITSEHYRKYNIEINSKNRHFILSLYKSNEDLVNTCNVLLVNPNFYHYLHYDTIQNLRQWQSHDGQLRIQSFLTNTNNKEQTLKHHEDEDQITVQFDFNQQATQALIELIIKLIFLHK